jgi:hypothetical protein
MPAAAWSFRFNVLALVINLLSETPPMNRHYRSARFPFLCSACALVLLTLFTAVPASAQSDDDDAKLRPAEPDYTVVNLPTTLPLPLHGSNFRLTHRFGENLRNDSFSTQASNLFGIDQGATIQFEYRFGIVKHVEAIAARTNFNKTIQLGGKFDAMHQDGSHPFGVSALLSVEGADNFQEAYKPAIGATFSRSFMDRAAFYAVPVWVHNTAGGVTPTTQNTFFMGIGGRVAILPTTYIVAEVTPRLGGYAPGDAEYAFALEKRVGGHVFSLVFANTFGTSYGQLAAGGFPHSLYMGFNLARKFF